MLFNADMTWHLAAELDTKLEQNPFTGQSRDGAVGVKVTIHKVAHLEQPLRHRYPSFTLSRKVENWSSLFGATRT